jgi:hypothetical protein
MLPLAIVVVIIYQFYFKKSSAPVAKKLPESKEERDREF